jgi:cyanate permease
MTLVSTVAAGGPWLAGWVRDHLGGFEAAFMLFAAIALVVLGAVVWMKPPKSPRLPEGKGHMP